MKKMIIKPLLLLFICITGLFPMKAAKYNDNATDSNITIVFAKEAVNYNETASDSNLTNEKSVEEAKLDPVSQTRQFSDIFSLGICDLMLSKETNNINISLDQTYGLFEYILQEDQSCPVFTYWQISSPPGTILNITFTYFRTRHCSDACLCDRLALWDVVKGQRKYRSYYCGHRDPWYVVTKTNKLLMRLEVVNAKKSFILMSRSKNLYLDDITGFVIIYKTLSADDYQYVSPVHEIKIGRGLSNDTITLNVPHMIINGYYVYHLKIREREQFRVKFSWKIRCSNIFIMLFDGPSERYPAITKYTTKDNINSTTATGFHLYVVLRIGEASHLLRDLCVNLKYGSELAPILEFYTSLVGLYKVDIRKRPFIHNYFQVFGINFLRIDGPNYDFCSIQGIALTIVKKVKKTGKYKSFVVRFCNIPKSKQFLSSFRVNIDMFLSVYSYSLSAEYDFNLMLKYANTNKDRGQFCQPVYSTFSAFDFYTKTVSYPGNTSFPLVMKVPSDHQIPCFHLRIAPGYHAQKTNIRVEIHGADYVLANESFDPFHQLNPPVTILFKESFLRPSKPCTGYIKTEKDDQNTVIINYQVDCPYIPIGFSLDIYNNMMCSVIPKDQTMLEKNRCQVLQGPMSVWTPSRFFLYFYCDKFTCDKNILDGPGVLIKVKQTPFILHNDIKGLESSVFAIPKSFKLLQEPVFPSIKHITEDLDTNIYSTCKAQRKLNWMSWNEANTYCQNDGKRLLTISDLKELQNIKPMFERCHLDLRYWALAFLGLKVMIFT